MRAPDLVPIRYERMLASPFAFFRGSAAVMAMDLATVPRTQLEVQLCGDAHLANFGVYGSPERELLFDKFRNGELPTLVVSKVANFSIDLPEAAVAIQVSGTFGSRQEEAQRLGRVLRPKSDGRTARFYAVTARDTVDQDFAAHRQRFLAEQGYAYRIVDSDDLPTLDAS